MLLLLQLARGVCVAMHPIALILTDKNLVFGEVQIVTAGFSADLGLGETVNKRPRGSKCPF